MVAWTQLAQHLELDWTDVWHHALEDVEAALVARVGLDDTNAAVCALSRRTSRGPWMRTLALAHNEYRVARPATWRYSPKHRDVRRLRLRQQS